MEQERRDRTNPKDGVPGEMPQKEEHSLGMVNTPPPYQVTITRTGLKPAYYGSTLYYKREPKSREGD